MYLWKDVSANYMRIYNMVSEEGEEPGTKDKVAQHQTTANVAGTEPYDTNKTTNR